MCRKIGKRLISAYWGFLLVAPRTDFVVPYRKGGLNLKVIWPYSGMDYSIAWFLINVNNIVLKWFVIINNLLLLS